MIEGGLTMAGISSVFSSLLGPPLCKPSNSVSISSETLASSLASCSSTTSATLLSAAISWSAIAINCEIALRLLPVSLISRVSCSSAYASSRHCLACWMASSAALCFSSNSASNLTSLSRISASIWRLLNSAPRSIIAVSSVIFFSSCV